MSVKNSVKLSGNLIFLQLFSSLFFLVYSKSEYTTRIGQCVRPSVRLSDNFRKESQIMVKFSTQFSLINVSVEFEDEPDWMSGSWVIAKTLIFPYGLLCENGPTLAFIKDFSYHSGNKISTIIHHSIENFMIYKMV